MKISGEVVVISDMHLGDVRVDEEVQADLCSFLAGPIMSRADQLIILGDCFELAQYTVREVWRRAEAAVRALHAVARQKRVTLVVGNHDLFLKEFTGEYPWLEIVYPGYSFKQAGKRFYLEHGHRYQAEYRKNPALYNALATAGRLLDYLPPEVEDYGGALFWQLKKYARLQKVTSDKTGAELEEDLSEFPSAALKLLRKGYDCVLFGHTHRPLVENFSGDGLYLNTGDWVVHRTYTFIRDGIPHQREWRRRNGKGADVNWQDVS